MKKPSRAPLRQTADHRTRLGVERREKTRASLVRSALRVFARNTLETRVIDMVTREARVSRGTFYNYFRTVEELFLEVAREASSEIIRIVDPLVQRQDDPAAGIACGVCMVVELSRKCPDLARFVLRGGPDAVSAGSLVPEVVSRDIRAGIATGRFSVADERLAHALVVGPVLMAFHDVLSGGVADRYPRELAQSVLQSLGVGKARAKGYAGRDFGEIEIPGDSLLATRRARQPTA